MSEYGYTVATDVEAYIRRYLMAHVPNVAFKLEHPREGQTTTYATPTCLIFLQDRNNRDWVADKATIGLAYYQGTGETVSQALVNMSEITGLLLCNAACMGEDSPLVAPIRDEANEFILAESDTTSHAKNVYFAQIAYIVARKVTTITV